MRLIFTKPQAHYTDQFPQSLKPASEKGMAVILVFPNPERDRKGAADWRSQNKPEEDVDPSHSSSFHSVSDYANCVTP